jgi:hypothetical protein
MALRSTRLIASLLSGLAFAFLTWLTIGDHPYPRPIESGFEWVGQAIIVLLLPGFFAGFVASGNIHVANTWVVALGNFAFYFGLAYLVGTSWEKRKARRRTGSHPGPVGEPPP